MELKKRWIIIFILFIGITAALEYNPRVVILRTTLPPTTTCPCNDSPYGTSMFLQELENNGMNVTIVNGLLDYTTLQTNEYDSIILLVIAADSLGPSYAERVLDYLQRYDKPTYIVVMDEYPTDGEQALSYQAEERYCNSTVQVTIARVYPTNPTATAVFSDGTSLQTGYTSYISLRGTTYPLAVEDQPASISMYGYRIVGWVYPSSGATRDKWTPLAVMCRSNKGGVLLIADSSIVINEALQADNTYGITAVRLLRDLAGEGRALVIVDQGMYLTQQARVAVALHPSFLLLQAGKIYASIEERVLNVLSSRNLLGAAATLAGVAVLLFSWGSSQTSSSVGEKRFRIKPVTTYEVPRDASCRSIVSHARSVGIERAIERIPDPAVRRRAEELYREVLDICVGGSVLGEIYRFLRGRGDRDAYRAYIILLGLTGLQPIYMSEGMSGEQRK